MAHEIRSSDRFGEVRANGDRAWHGLGIEIPIGLSATEAFPQIGLNWQTELLPVFAHPMHGAAPIQLPDHRAHVRKDTGDVLGIVSDGYKPLDNGDLAKFADAVLGEDAAASCETAGSLYGGRRVFCLLRLPGNIVAARGDELATYLALSNGHGGTAAFACYPTTVRIVCANTLRMSEKDLTKGVRFMHTGDVDGKLRTAKLALGFAHSELGKLEQQVKALASSSMTNVELSDYFGVVFDTTFPPPAKDDIDLVQSERWLQKRSETIAFWVNTLDTERTKLSARDVTTWLAYNAVSEWHDHERGRFGKVADSDKRVHSNLFGASHAAKTKAFRQALALL